MSKRGAGQDRSALHATPMAATARRRLFAVAYAFPPAGPIGTMRTLRLVKRLDADGWATTVLTATRDTFPADMPFDDALLDRVPPSVEVIRAGVFRGLTKLTGLWPKGPGTIPAPRDKSASIAG